MPYGVITPATAAVAPVTTAGAPLAATGDSLAEFRADLLQALGNRSDVQPGGAADYSKIDRWVNKGYLYVAGILDLKELWASVAFSLVASQPFYAMPASMMWIKRAMLVDSVDYLDGGIEMDQIDEQTWRNLPNDSEVQFSGSELPPRNYFRYGRTVVVWPYPAVGNSYTMAVDFRVRPTKLTNSAHCPILPEEFHDVIGQAALWRAQRDLRMRKDAAVTQNEMLSALRPLINTDAEEREAMHMTVQPVSRYGSLYKGMY